MSQYKPFSKKLYDIYNQKGIETAIDFLYTTFGFVPIRQKKEAYKAYDLRVLNKNKEIIGIEVEVKNVWNVSGKWQGYDTLDIPYRKKESMASIFIVVNKYYDTLAYIEGLSVKESKVIQKKTRYTSLGNEQFFSVPISKIIFFKRNKDIWEKI